MVSVLSLDSKVEELTYKFSRQLPPATTPLINWRGPAKPAIGEFVEMAEIESVPSKLVLLAVYAGIARNSAC